MYLTLKNWCEALSDTQFLVIFGHTVFDIFNLMINFSAFFRPSGFRLIDQLDKTLVNGQLLANQH